MAIQYTFSGVFQQILEIARELGWNMYINQDKEEAEILFGAADMVKVFVGIVEEEVHTKVRYDFALPPSGFDQAAIIANAINTALGKYRMEHLRAYFSRGEGFVLHAFLDVDDFDVELFADSMLRMVYIANHFQELFSCMANGLEIPDCLMESTLALLFPEGEA